MHRKLALILLFVSTLPALGQHHIFRSVNVSLPSPECYRILQDNRGFVWIATEQGLCRFDGQNTKIYGPKDGMSEKAVYALRKDEQGLIWLLTKKGHVLHIRNNKVVDAGFRKQFGDSTMIRLGYDFFFQKKSVIIPIGYSTALRLNRIDKSFVESEKKRSNPRLVVLEHKEGQVVPLVIYNTSVHAYPDDVEVWYNDKDNPSRNTSFKLSGAVNNHAPQVITSKLNERVLFSICAQLVEIGKHGALNIHPMPNRILSLLPDSRGGLWVGILGNGVRYYENGDFSRPPVQSLSGLSVSNIMEDREGHIWCTTLEKGAYICQQPVILAFNNFAGLHRSLDVMTADRSNLLISSKQNEVIVINSLRKIERLTLIGSSIDYVTALKKTGDQWLVGSPGILQSGTRKKDRIILRKVSQPAQGLQFSNWNGITYVLAYRKIFRYTSGKAQAVTDDFSLLARTFLVLSPEKFLVYTTNQLQYIRLENGKTSSQFLFKSSATVSRLFLTKSKRVFILTKGEGLWELCGETVVNRNKSMHIPTWVLNDMAEDSDGNLWIGSNEGLLKISPNEKGYGIPQLYNEQHGFPSKVCSKLAIAGKLLAVSTTEGLITFPLKHNLQSETAPGLSFHKAVLKGKSVNIRNAALEYHENSLLLYFSVQSYHRNHGQSLSYTLDDGSTVQRGTSGTILSFKNLDPGTYHLAIFGENIFGVKSSQPILVDFTILPPYWLTWWFISGCLVLTVIILLCSFRWIRKRTERRLELSNNLKMQLAKSQLSALQAQMNPHFLFNSISSIQNFIMSNKREEAYDYLTAFSRLIRRTLNNSRNQYITLAEEMETLKLYMELEQRRYNYTFDFHLELSNEIVPENILLPAALIQPLLENAIWHGVAGINAKRRGEILLRISTEEPDSLFITVIDNGAGIQPSDTAHQSLAIRIIEEQLLLLSGNPEKPSPRVQLKAAENGQGTAVSFTIPILKKE